ncbi:MAG: hypothetical protein KJT03_14310 [Verrucomicrobiae bacterium]|nr:hypothetical protein [Verrucomicrobiae bacterium]
MRIYRFFLLSLSLIAVPNLIQAAGFKDDFSDPKLELRQALRGEWTYKDGVASCVSDPELYKQFANHGPILRWPVEFTNGTVECEFKPEGCQRVVITLNEDGHVFRISLTEEKNTRIFGWIGKSSKENKPETIAKDGVPSVDSIDGQWTRLRLTINGDTGVIQIGDYKATLKHGSLARRKGEFTISFAFGSCAVRNVSVKVK